MFPSIIEESREQMKEDEAEKVMVELEQPKPVARTEKGAFEAEILLILIEDQKRVKPLKQQSEKSSNHCIHKQKI